MFINVLDRIGKGFVLYLVDILFETSSDLGIYDLLRSAPLGC